MKRVFALLLSMVLLLGVFPVFSFNAEAAAAGTVTEATAKANLDELTKALKNKYFTTDQKAHGSSDSESGMVNVIAASWLKETVKRVPSSTSASGTFKHYYYDVPYVRGKSCCGFANFAGWYIFSSKASDTVKFSKLAQGEFNAQTMLAAKPGDVLRFGNATDSGTHSAIFVSASSTTVTVLDSNWGNECKVTQHTIKYGKYKYVTISRANNYQPEYKVELWNNYSGKNYMPVVEADSFKSGLYLSRNTSVATVSGDSTVKRVSDCDTLKIVNKSAGGSSSSKDLSFCTYTNGGITNDDYGGGQTLTLSFWAKASTAGTKMYFRWGYESSYRNITLTTDWKFYTVKMNRTIAMDNVMHPYVDKAGTVWLSEIQLEEGSTATDFAANGENDRLSILTVKCGGKYSGLPTPVRPGYAFDGWYTKPAGGTQVKNGDKVLVGNIHLFAHWTKSGVVVQPMGVGSEYYSVLGQTVTVTYSQPCRVGYLSGENYVGLTAAANADGSYSFTAPDEVTEVILVMKGDIDANGLVEGSDVTQLKAAFLGKKTLTATQIFASDIDANGLVEGSDVTQLKAAFLGKKELTW